ncbi:unnamed protein product [Lactuca saligna]|uniref:Uncharacterized protein n=1 Tax=Lactuca saligna TaxID=75948 RepID=A0AA35Z5A0_LACSI|nr:unnamed protein product [Lactuca saligna]
MNNSWRCFRAQKLWRDIFKHENIEFSTDELVKEVENSVVEFKKHAQEYDEESIQEQVQEVLEGAKVVKGALEMEAELDCLGRPIAVDDGVGKTLSDSRWKAPSQQVRRVTIHT